jgi:hypothetical protein
MDQLLRVPSEARQCAIRHRERSLAAAVLLESMTTDNERGMRIAGTCVGDATCWGASAKVL